MRRRGFTLIELMISLALMGIAGHVAWDQITHLQRVTAQQAAREGLVRGLENDVELAVACEAQACLRAWAADRGRDVSWTLVPMTRSLRAGPHGTWRVEVSARLPGSPRDVAVSRLVWVTR